MILLDEYNAILSELRRSPSVDLCYLNIAQYDALCIRRELYGDPAPSSCPAYRILALLYEMEGKYSSAARTTTEALRKGVADSGAIDRLRRVIVKGNLLVTEEIREMIGG